MSGKRKGVVGCGEGGRRKIPGEEGAAAGPHELAGVQGLLAEDAELPEDAAVGDVPLRDAEAARAIRTVHVDAARDMFKKSGSARQVLGRERRPPRRGPFAARASTMAQSAAKFEETNQQTNERKTNERTNGR